MSRAHKTDLEEKICSVNLTSVDEDSRSSGIDTYSVRNSSTGSEFRASDPRVTSGDSSNRPGERGTSRP